MTLIYFTARSNLVTSAFLWEKVKTVDFSEHLQPVTWIRLKKWTYVSIEGQGHFLTLAQGHLHTKLKTCFSQKALGQSKPNFICKLSGTRKWKLIDMMLRYHRSVAFTYWPIWFGESWVQPYLIASFGHVIYLIGSFELVMVQPSFPQYLRHWNSSASRPRGIFPIVVSSAKSIKLLWLIFILYYSDNIAIKNYYRSFCFN